ncbi:MAG: DegT/DnrJ/EryC1/StrS family aminotransferase [Anaerolineae bacterium]
MADRLAIEGGNPVRERPFPAWPIWDDREEKALLEVLHSGRWGMLDGDRVHTFEKAFAEYQHARYGVCVMSGTAGLEIGLRAVGVGAGDEVITTPYTFIATTNAVLTVNAVPVLVDIDPETFNLDAGLIEAAITPRTRAILPVHFAGQPADMDAVLDIAQRYGLRVVEDACQGWGAEWRGQRLGALGDLGAFSFQSSKNINAGEGGIILTNDDELEDIVWSMANVGRTRHGLWYEYAREGWNSRLTEWQGAILLAQLERADELAERRHRNALYLTERLAAIPGIHPLKVDARVTRHAWHLFIFRYESQAFGGLPRAKFIEALQGEGIPCTPGYHLPINQTPPLLGGLERLRSFLDDVPPPRDCPVTARMCKHEAVWFTQNMLLGDEQDMDDIAGAILKIQHWACN